MNLGKWKVFKEKIYELSSAGFELTTWAMKKRGNDENFGNISTYLHFFHLKKDSNPWNTEWRTRGRRLCVSRIIRRYYDFAIRLCKEKLFCRLSDSNTRAWAKNGEEILSRLRFVLATLKKVVWAKIRKLLTIYKFTLDLQVACSPRLSSVLAGFHCIFFLYWNLFL